MLPGEDGLEILSRLKASEVTKEIPVIMVTAKGAEYDKVMGLDCGADDYITKPFGMMEFIARVRAVLRRAGKEEKENDVLETGDLQIQVKQHQVLAKGEKVTLTLKEFELLKFLMENKGIVLTRDRLLGHVWGYDFDGETRTVDVHVRTLRQKLGECGELIETVRGVGYRIEAEKVRCVKSLSTCGSVDYRCDYPDFFTMSWAMYNNTAEQLRVSVRNECEYYRYFLDKMGDDSLDKPAGKITASRVTLIDTDGTVLFDSVEDAKMMEIIPGGRR